MHEPNQAYCCCQAPVLHLQVAGRAVLNVSMHLHSGRLFVTPGEALGEDEEGEEATMAQVGHPALLGQGCCSCRAQ